MNPQPDKLFRNKLKDYGQPVSASAWNKIEANLAPKKSGIPMGWSVAAALLLLAVGTFLLWPAARPSIDSPVLLSESTHPTPLNHEKSPSISDTKYAPPALPSKTKKKSSNKTIEQKISIVKIQTQDTLPSETHLEVQVSYHNTETETTNTEPTPITEDIVPTTKTSITLIYEADEVNEKYFNEEAYLQATTSKKKPSTLKKLLTKAYTLKTNQSPIGDLRQLKNEILALNSKNEKQRNENK